MRETALSDEQDMANGDKSVLRGYDSYRVSLGDEMRGERASMGKSLLDVQRELRIKAAHIDAIENSNPGGVPYRGFVTGYVRAYARYLGMDEDATLRRFCEESGFEPNATAPATPHAGTVKTRRRGDDLDAVIAGSRLAAASRAAAVNADLGSTLRGLTSLSVMLALVGAIGYGGWALLQNIQRVEFAPLPDAPEALATLPEFDSLTRIASASVAPAPSIDAEALAAVYAAQEVAPPRIAPRDGPISALDPERAGVYASAEPPEPPMGGEMEIGPPIDPAFVSALVGAALADEGGVQPNATAAADVQPGVALIADAEAWVRVRDGAGRTLHEGIMKAGEVWPAPDDASGLTLRAGNAGGVYVRVDGVRFGPLGAPGAVVSNVRLDGDSIRGAFASDRTADAGPIAATAQLSQR
jgi:cytoskeletal protein RodZ